MNTSKVTRVEVIDHTKPLEEGGGRAYVHWERRCKNHRTEDCPHCKPKVQVMLQDDGRTLKIFISNQ